MKSSTVVITIVLFISLTSCTSTLPIIPLSRVDKNILKTDINPLQRSDYEIIDKISGTGKLVLNGTPIKIGSGVSYYVINSTPESVFKMGYFRENMLTTSDYPFPKIQTYESQYIVESPEKLVESNAIYDLITQADKAGADAVIMPSYRIEVNRIEEHLQYECTVHAIAIKVKRDYQ